MTPEITLPKGSINNIDDGFGNFRRIGVRDRTSAALWARENLTGPGTT